MPGPSDPGGPGGTGDPWLTDFYGNLFQFKGLSGTPYNMYCDPHHLAVHAMVETFDPPVLTRPEGTYFSHLTFMFRDGAVVLDADLSGVHVLSPSDGVDVRVGAGECSGHAEILIGEVAITFGELAVDVKSSDYELWMRWDDFDKPGDEDMRGVRHLDWGISRYPRVVINASGAIISAHAGNDAEFAVPQS